MKLRLLVPLAVAIAATQIFLLIALAPAGPVSERWLKLAQWDAVWFESIAERGYVSDDPPSFQNPEKANVAFFPALPLLASSLSGVSGMQAKHALIVVSHVACIFFWLYFLLLCGSLGLPFRAAFAAALFVFSYIGSYFIALPYSEGVFLTGLLGMILFTLKKRPALAALHGFLMAGSRFVGVFALLYPLVYGALFLHREKKLSPRKMLPYLGISSASALAPLLFFAYCQIKFGHWDMYFITQRMGWGSNFDFFLPYFPGEYLRDTPAWLSRRGDYQGATFGRLASAAFASLMLLCIFLEVLWAKKSGFSRRLGQELRWPLYLCGWLIFSVSLARAGAGEYYFGMYRYTLTALVPVVLALLELGWRWRSGGGGLRRSFAVAGASILAFGCLASLYVQAGLARQFMGNVWME